VAEVTRRRPLEQFFALKAKANAMADENYSVAIAG